MKYYETLTEALADLKSRGYTEDFSLQGSRLSAAAKELKIYPQDFEVDEFYRFEGYSDPDDNTVLYAISAGEGLKGVLVDAYGVYAENVSEVIIRKLHIKGR